MIQKRPLRAVAATAAATLIFQGCDGFVSKRAQTTTTTTIRPRSTGSQGFTTFLLPQEKIPIGSGPEDVDENSIINTNVPGQYPLLDPTVENLVDSMAEIGPNDVFDDADVLLPPTEMVAATTTNQSTEMVLSEDAIVGREEDVKAIMEASEQAAVEAEASMSPELIQQLEASNINSTIPTTTMVEGDVNGSLNVDVNANANANADMDRAMSVDAPDILSASSVVGEPATMVEIVPEAPKVSRILKFAIPAIGVWLCGPLLSLIDTSAVGIFSGTIQQAALNPAVAVTDYAALLIAFMYTGATNLVAAAREADRGTVDKPTTTKVLVGSMRLSTYVGAGLGAILFVFARPLLKAIIGNDAISPAVFAAAMKYVRIRALGMPAAAILGSTQAACLGMQDIRSPLYVLAAAAVVNFFGDIFFVQNAHPLLGGAAGAAWATVISQYTAVFLFVKWLTHKAMKNTQEQPRVMNLSNAIMEITGKPSSKGNTRRKQFRDALQSFGTTMKTKQQSSTNIFMAKIMNRPTKTTAVPVKTAPKSDSFSVRGFLSDRFSYKDLIKFPSAETRKDFAPYLAPVTATQVGRVSGYIAMSHVVASSLGTNAMAAQQVIVSLFYCLTPVADSLSLTAQSFLPAISEKGPSKERSAALRTTLINFLKAGGIFGAALVAAVGTIPLVSSMFTSDPVVIGLVNSVIPQLLGFFSVHGMLCACEGVLLGQKDLNYLGRMYAAYFFVVPYFMLQVKRAALSGSKAVGLTSVWTVFLGYQLFRWAAWLGRAAFLQKKIEEQSSSLSSSLSSTAVPTL